tara:strand:+ start:872 stop:1060 length:189 start_codon:yes stop_codon:yes gene_type:complete
MTKKRESNFKNINLSAKREIEETYSEYRKRMRENYYKCKYYLRGELFWDSLSKGTYRIYKNK